MWWYVSKCVSECATDNATGRAIGRATGRAIGRATGRAIGRAIGRATGRAIGRASELGQLPVSSQRSRVDCLNQDLLDFRIGRMSESAIYRLNRGFSQI